MSLLFYLLSLLLTLSTATPRSLIIDTDLDIDDMWAIAYMIKNNDFSTYWNIKAVTVEATGWSDAVFGVPNALSLLEILGCTDIPVSYSDVSTALLDPSGTLLGSVSAALKIGVDKYLTCINASIQPFVAQSSPYGSEELIVDIILNSETPVDFLLLGPWTNLARALAMERRIVDNIGTLYVSGGNFDGRPIKESYFPWVGAKTSGSSWNIFSDPLAVVRTLQTKLPVIMMSSEAQDYLPVNQTEVDTYSNKYSVDQFFVDFVLKIAPCTNQSLTAIDYWDPSASIWMYQLAKGANNTICTEWEDLYVWVDMYNGGGFGRTFNKTNGSPARVCNAADSSLFLDEFWEVMGSNTITCPPKDTTDYSKTPSVTSLENQVENIQSGMTNIQTNITDLQGQIDNLLNQITQLQQTVNTLKSEGVIVAGCWWVMLLLFYLL